VRLQPWDAGPELQFEGDGTYTVSDFRRRTGTISHARSQRPRFTFTAEWPDVANGGRAGVALYRVTGYKGRRLRLRELAMYRGRFDAGHMALTIRRPHAVGFYLGRFSFSGTRFLRAGVDPNPVLLQALRGRLQFVPPREFPGC
jgi:hypothetical protein